MEFISYSSPSEFKSRRTSKTVRKHVTRRQHRLKREAQEKASEGKESQRDDVSPAPGPPSQSLLSHRNTQLENNASTSHIRPPQGQEDPAKNAMSPMSTSPRLPPRVPYEAMLPCQSAFNTLESYIQGTMVPTHVSAFGLHPVEAQAASQWFTSSSINEPALYTSALLTAAPNFTRVSPDLISYLHSTTVTSLISALSDDQRRQDPALLIAVECLTFYECLYGDPLVAQRVHRPAMRRLIQAHGGRDSVEIPISWKKVSVMADIIMEIQMGSEGPSSFLQDEKHGGGGILEAEWTDALKLYLPDVDEGTIGPSSLGTRRDEISKASADPVPR